MHPNVTRVIAAAAAAQHVVEVREFPQGTRTAREAADAIGCELGQIVKSLVFTVDGETVVALLSGPDRLDEEKLATAAGGTDVARADADAVRKVTGYPIGGVPPFGHDTPLRTLVDKRLTGYDVVWAAAGTPNTVFPVAPGDLLRLAGGTEADLAV